MAKKKVILVTGAAGFIGSHLCEALLNRGDHIIAVDNFDPFYPEKIKRRNIEPLLSSVNFHFYQDSILKIERMKQIFAAHSPTHVVHLAARAGVRPSIQQPSQYQKINVEGTTNMLEMAHKFEVRKFVFASSSSVYGNNKKVPFSETDNVDYPISPYAATKKAGELLCYTYHYLYRINVFALRFFTVYGPRQRPEMAIHKFTRAIDKGETIQVYGYGRQKRDFTYIDDIIQGVLHAIDRVEGYEIINLGESQTVTTNQMIEYIEKALGKKAIREDLPVQPGDVEQTYADIRKARQLLNYQPTTPIEEGIKKFVRWYLENKTAK